MMKWKTNKELNKKAWIRVLVRTGEERQGERPVSERGRESERCPGFPEEPRERTAHVWSVIAENSGERSCCHLYAIFTSPAVT